MEEFQKNINNVLLQISILKGIQKDDKIYYYDNKMYYHNPSTFQSIFRTITGESRENTFKYLETFIATYVHIYDLIQRKQFALEERLVRKYKSSLNDIHNILGILKLTYPDSNKQIDNLALFLSNSIYEQ